MLKYALSAILVLTACACTQQEKEKLEKFAEDVAEDAAADIVKEANKDLMPDKEQHGSDAKRPHHIADKAKQR